MNAFHSQMNNIKYNTNYLIYITHKKNKAELKYINKIYSYCMWCVTSGNYILLFFTTNCMLIHSFYINLINYTVLHYIKMTYVEPFNQLLGFLL